MASIKWEFQYGHVHGGELDMVFKVSVEGYLDELYSVHVYEDNVGEYKFDIIAHFGQEDEEFSWEADSPVFDTLTTAVVAGFTHLVREIENYY